MEDAFLIVLLLLCQTGLCFLAWELGRRDGVRSNAERRLEIIGQWRATLADARAQEQVLHLLAQSIRDHAPHLISAELVAKMQQINGSESVN